MSDLKIVGLKVDGFKNLKAIEMEFSQDGGLIFIKGANEQGKTSVIESLWWLFSGKSVINHDKIQHGKDKMIGSVNLGEFAIDRVQTHKSDRIEIKRKDGFSIANKPQAFLDQLTNELTFNPIPFLNKKADDQLKFMMKFKNIDFSEIDNEIIRVEQERLLVGREIKAIGEVREVPKVDPVDVSELLQEKNRIQAEIEDELDEIRLYNLSQHKRLDAISNKEMEVDEWRNRVNNLQDELKLAIQRLEETESELSKMPRAEKIKAEIASKTTSEIDSQIMEAGETNRKAEEWKKSEEKTKDLATKNTLRAKLDEKIKELRESKRRKLAESDTGVVGLEIRETGLFYKGNLLENCSDSEKLKVSMQMCVAMKPLLNAVFLDRGESFDAKRIAELDKFARENNIQCFVTQVSDEKPDEIPEGVFYIEAGEIK